MRDLNPQDMPMKLGPAIKRQAAAPAPSPDAAVQRFNRDNHQPDGTVRPSLSDFALELNAGISLSAIAVDAFDKAFTAAQQTSHQRPSKQPPLGLMPHKIWLEQRQDAILDACDRYRAAGLDIPDWWLAEIEQLTFDIDQSTASNMSRVPKAMQILRDAMLEDPDYARSWHDNIAMAVRDTSTNFGRQQNPDEAAKTLMHRAFGYPIPEHERQQDLMDLPHAALYGDLAGSNDPTVRPALEEINTAIQGAMIRSARSNLEDAKNRAMTSLMDDLAMMKPANILLNVTGAATTQTKQPEKSLKQTLEEMDAAAEEMLAWERKESWKRMQRWLYGDFLTPPLAVLQSQGDPSNASRIHRPSKEPNHAQEVLRHERDRQSGEDSRAT